MNVHKSHLKMVEMRTELKTNENSSNEFCEFFNQDAQNPCFNLPTSKCASCSRFFCYPHLWSSICLSCLKENISKDVSRSFQSSPDTLIQQINQLDSQNDELSLEITKKNFKIKLIKSSLAESRSSNLENIKKKIKTEKQNRKNLEVTASNLKKAVCELKTHENLVSASTSRYQDVGWHLAEIEVLKKTNSALIEHIDIVKKSLRKSVPYANIRNFICGGCSSKLKSQFGNQIFNSGSKDGSILNSILMFRRTERPFIQEKSCNCETF